MSQSKRGSSWRSFFLLGTVLVLGLIFLRTPKPCEEPLTYGIGRVDERFGISRSDFSMAIREAAAVWAKPLDRELFREEPDGQIEISLIYDYRQETSDKLKQIGSRLDDNRNVYDNTKTRCESLKAEYEQKRVALESEFSDLNARITAYNAEIEVWNRQGGAPEAEGSRLEARKKKLDEMREILMVRQEEVNRLLEEVNAAVQVTNEVVARQNEGVDHYRDVGRRLGDEFQEGFFESKGGRQSITLFHFENEAKMVRLLVHELGHALRLEHSDNPKAVMYRMNQGDTAELTQDDIAALRARCGVK